VTNLTLRMYTAVTTAISSMLGDLKDERGQDLIEYAVLAGGIGIALFVIFTQVPLTANLTTFVTKIGQCVSFNNAC
jgi:Flp pilus assembly pilin Flp